MSIRSKIMNAIMNPLFSHKDRIRTVQTLEMLEFTGPFTTPKFQGDTDCETGKLRVWVNQSGYLEQANTKHCYDSWFDNPDYQKWAKMCPFKKEMDQDEWAERGWFWE